MAGFLQKLFRGTGNNSGADEGKSSSRIGELPIRRRRSANLLVIDADPAHNWYQIFSGATIELPSEDPSAPGLVKFPVVVEQSSWDCLNLTAYTDSSGVQCDINPAARPIPGTAQNRLRRFKPDFLLVRNEVRGVTPDQDFRNILYGLLYGQVESVNSLSSIIMMCERPIIHASLLEIQRRVGSDVFPVIEQTYYPNHKEMLITPGYPLVVKVGHAHAGFGKMLVHDHHQFSDFKSVMAVTRMYCTAEPFVNGSHDLRIQKLGRHLRAFKRTSMSGNWKTNTGTSVVEEIEVLPRYRRWAELAGDMLGGLDICTVDAVVNADTGEETILEVNGTSSGLMPDRKEEDHAHIRQLVIGKMQASMQAKAKAAARLCLLATAAQQTKAAAAADDAAAVGAGSGCEEQSKAEEPGTGDAATVGASADSSAAVDAQAPAAEDEAGAVELVEETGAGGGTESTGETAADESTTAAVAAAEGETEQTETAAPFGE